MTATQTRDNTSRPLHERAIERRGVLGWTQAEAAEKAGMSLRAYNDFENGKTKPQGRNRLNIIAALSLDRGGDEVAETTREGWPLHIQVFLDTMGAFLMAQSLEDQLAFIHDENRRIFDGG